MKTPGSKPRARKLLASPLAALALVTGLASPTQIRADCLVTYADCVDAASEEDTFWRRSAAGLRCYTEFISCLQRRLT
ncbi:MAG: hypothetical protein ABI610_08405 [Acidobacteriota bacterium]